MAWGAGGVVSIPKGQGIMGHPCADRAPARGFALDRVVTPLERMVGVTIVTFWVAELGRMVVNACCHDAVQLHHGFVFSSPTIVLLWITALVALFMRIRPRPRLFAVATGFYTGGTLAKFTPVLKYSARWYIERRPATLRSTRCRG